jgi:hypothetical protein
LVFADTLANDLVMTSLFGLPVRTAITAFERTIAFGYDLHYLFVGFGIKFKTVQSEDCNNTDLICAQSEKISAFGPLSA